MAACTAGCGAMVCVCVCAEEKSLFLNYLEEIRDNYLCAITIRITHFLQSTQCDLTFIGSIRHREKEQRPRSHCEHFQRSVAS